MFNRKNKPLNDRMTREVTNILMQIFLVNLKDKPFQKIIMEKLSHRDGGGGHQQCLLRNILKIYIFIYKSMLIFTKIAYNSSVTH